MLVEERRQRVLDLVSQRGFISLADLAQTIQVSESTIRRDLDHWHSQGTVRRTHGGAIYVGNGEIVHAPSSGKRVRRDRVDSPYWKKHFSEARRLSA